MMDRAARDCVAILPEELRQRLTSRPEQGSGLWEELRLRAGRGLFILQNGRERRIRDAEIDRQTLYSVLERATGASYQSASEQLRRGFYTMPGGHRIGVTGHVTRHDGAILAFRELSSLNIRIARQVLRAAEPVEQELVQGSEFPGTLILSAPGCGKTTLLREVVRLLSDRNGLRIGLADERGEVAALWRGVPQFDIGAHTDVIDGCEKAEGLLMLLRSMNPQVIAADELTSPEDVRAISAAANCGVSVLATAHASTVEELRRRPVYAPLMEQQIFRRVIRISVDRDGTRILSVEEPLC